ncbi:MAG: DUF1697 domain-containing protein [Gemmatimonadetes bacterium]|nr:DUF1697 domain-containing protein [Gemmatimonadota bacterium]
MAQVVFLRGVNVGGHRTFRPTLLVQQLKRYEVVNIGAAGTFVIRTPASQSQLRAELRRRLPLETEVIICQGRDLLKLASRNPLGDQPMGSDVVRFVSILAKRPALVPSIPMSLPPDGKWLLRILAVEDRFVLGQYRRQMKVLSYLGSIDRIFGVPVTTRNWNTITAIIKVLRHPSAPPAIHPPRYKSPKQPPARS